MAMLRAATPERLCALSDGVFAVLITILVLDLRPPDLPAYKALLLRWPAWLSYAVSYLFIAIVWANHHHLIRYATKTTTRLMWFNFAHLFSVSLLPLSTAWMAVSGFGAPAGLLLCGGLLPGERDLHPSDQGADRPRSGTRRADQGAHDHARPIDRDPVPLRSGGGGSAEIPSGRIGDLCLLPGRLSETRGPRIGDSKISFASGLAPFPGAMTAGHVTEVRRDLRLCPRQPIRGTHRFAQGGILDPAVAHDRDRRHNGSAQEGYPMTKASR